jgi:hypothetical protein
MFYKLRGFQRLQIHNFWTPGSKVMNLASYREFDSNLKIVSN